LAGCGDKLARIFAYRTCFTEWDQDRVELQGDMDGHVRVGAGYWVPHAVQIGRRASAWSVSRAWGETELEEGSLVAILQEPAAGRSANPDDHTSWSMSCLSTAKIPRRGELETRMKPWRLVRMTSPLIATPHCTNSSPTCPRPPQHPHTTTTAVHQVTVGGPTAHTANNGSAGKNAA